MQQYKRLNATTKFAQSQTGKVTSQQYQQFPKEEIIQPRKKGQQRKLQEDSLFIDLLFSLQRLLSIRMYVCTYERHRGIHWEQAQGCGAKNSLCFWETAPLPNMKSDLPMKKIQQFQTTRQEFFQTQSFNSQGYRLE